MSTTYNLPDKPVVIGGSPERRVRISGEGNIQVDGKPLKGPIVVDKAVFLTGEGSVTTEVTDDKATRRPDTKGDEVVPVDVQVADPPEAKPAKKRSKPKEAQKAPEVKKTPEKPPVAQAKPERASKGGWR